MQSAEAFVSGNFPTVSGSLQDQDRSKITALPYLQVGTYRLSLVDPVPVQGINQAGLFYFG